MYASFSGKKILIFFQVPLDKNITFHKTIAWTILLFTLLHVGSHYFNFNAIGNANSATLIAANLPPTATSYTVAFGTVAGSTGHLLVIVMLIMYSAAMEHIRRKYFEIFWYSHHLFILFFTLLLSHGSGCLIQANGGLTVNETRKKKRNRASHNRGCMYF